MKSAKFILPLMLVLSTSSCGLLSRLLNGHKGSSDSNTSENSGSGNNGNNSNASNGSAASSAKSYNDVVSDINSAFSITMEYNNDGYYEYAFDMSEDGGDYSNTQAGEALLKPGAQAIAAEMPSYLGTGSGKFWTSSEDYWEDGSNDTVYQIVFEGSNSTFQADVEIVSYYYSNAFVGQIVVWQLSNS